MKNELQKTLEWRYAVKKFDAEKKIPADIWSTLENALVLTPSSYGLQPWKFYIIQDMNIRAKLRPASWNQSQVTDCSHYVVFTLKQKIDESYIDEYMATIAQKRNHPVENLAGFKKAISGDVVTGPRSKISEEWAARQCYIALGNFMTAAALLGVDTCPMEGFEPAKYDEILGLNGTGYRTVVACAAGYRSKEDPLANWAKVRFPHSKMIVNL